MQAIFQQLGGQVPMMALMVLVINAIVHVLFAGAVARDAGRLETGRRQTFLVSGYTWAFATLVGGILVAGTYWLIHYSKFRHD